jgi:hypothetical protein
LTIAAEQVISPALSTIDGLAQVQSSKARSSRCELSSIRMHWPAVALPSMGPFPSILPVDHTGAFCCATMQ